jgi:Family of unknown function (DUF6338)
MKFENFSSIFFIISVLVPGFIYNGVISNLIPLRRSREREVLFLRSLTATAFNYALCSPLIYLLVFGLIFPYRPVAQGLCWFAIIFVVPVILAILNAWIMQKDGLTRLARMMRLRFINPIPTGWDWIFSTTGPCYVLITLGDGTEIAGYFGSRSMASSDPERKDIYIEKVYKVPEDGSPWVEVERSLGMHIDGAQIAYIEFRG